MHKILLFLVTVLLVACATPDEEVPKSPTGVPVDATPTQEVVENLVWDSPAEIVGCDFRREAPLLDEALSRVNLNRSTFSVAINDGYFADEFTLPWITEMLESPMQVGCYEGFVAGALDYYLAQPHPVAGIIRHAATLLSLPPDREPPINPEYSGSFEDALEAICLASGGECFNSQGEIPEDLKEALTPILLAIVRGIEARTRMDKETERTLHGPLWWHENGGNFILRNNREAIPDAGDEKDRAFLLGEGARRELYRAAAQIAYAIEDIDWEPFVGRLGIRYDLKTSVGWIHIRDGADEIYEENGESILFFLDLGGDDIHYDDIASNTTVDNPVSIAIDLEGADRYTYIAIETEYDDVSGLVSTDEYGRYESGISKSKHFRQGAGRYGIALLFDFGNEDDSYYSIRGSQGYAHLGVGGLYDAGGNNKFFAEEASQGSAQFGIGFVITAGSGDDMYYSFAYSQGFGFTGGAGINLNAGGNDTFVCNHGNPELGGLPLYNSPQLPGKGNSSFCQGAGFGKRTAADGSGATLSGGFGILRKIKGNGSFEASVFAQGTGFWRGAGIFSVGPGDHTFDAFYYAQGGSAHFGVGVAVIGKGESVFNAKRAPVYAMLGAGHDLSLGALIKEGGHDTYHIPGFGGGSSNCNGVGLFIDNDGDDQYIAESDFAMGVGYIGSCLGYRPNVPSIGIFIDAGGDDTFYWPESEHPAPGNGTQWGYSRGNEPYEFGSGLDGEGESGIHSTN